MDGRPVADLVPIAGARTWVPKDRVLQLLDQSPLDRRFARDIAAATIATIESLDLSFPRVAAARGIPNLFLRNERYTAASAEFHLALKGTCHWHPAG